MISSCFRHFYKILFIVLFSISGQASNSFSAEVGKNFHAGKTSAANLREYIESQDYRKALRFVEETILPLDLAYADPQQIAHLVEETANILFKHNGIDEIEPDASFMTWAEESFQSFQTLEQFERANPSLCALQSDDFKNFIVRATQGLSIAKKSTFEKTMSQIWNEVKHSIESDRMLSDKSQNDIASALILNAIYCVKLSKASAQSTSALRENEGIFVWSLAYSGNGMHVNRAQVLQRNLGSKFNAFVRQYNHAIENNRAWSYPGVVSYIPALKNPRRAILNFVNELQGHLKTSSAQEAAAFAHQSFVKLHVFKDGNGRMARLLANIILVQANQKPLIVTNDPCYMEATEEGFRDLQRFLDFMNDPSCKYRQKEEL